MLIANDVLSCTQGLKWLDRPAFVILYLFPFSTRCIAATWPLQEEVDLEDFDIEEELPGAAEGSAGSLAGAAGTIYTHVCRCGGEFRLSSTDVYLRVDIVACEFCSLAVKVNYENFTDEPCDEIPSTDIANLTVNCQSSDRTVDTLSNVKSSVTAETDKSS